jgi:hypothetical protein
MNPFSNKVEPTDIMFIQVPRAKLTRNQESPGTMTPAGISESL